MALAQRHRDTIYKKWSPVLGKETTEALLLEFPLREQDEPATREFVHATAAEIRTELAELRTEVARGFQRQTTLLASLYVGSITAVGGILGIFSALT